MIMDLANREPFKSITAMPTEYHIWQPIFTAPYDRDLELAVINREGTHALVFPCRRIPSGWARANTSEKIEVSPTHWRDWTGIT